MMENCNKSRDISLVDYYHNLQLEFVSYFVRAKTYRKDYVEFYNKICEGKRDKIKNISSRNNLPSIFDNEDLKNQCVSKFLNNMGLPNFLYKNAEVQKKMECWDKFNYFSKGVSVKVVISGRVILGTITKNDTNHEVLSVNILDSNVVNDFHYSDVARLFPDDFFKF